MVFHKFKNIIESEMDNETPQFKEIEKERKIFDNAEDVIKFWKSLWCRPDKGGPHAEWLNEYADYFCTYFKKTSQVEIFSPYPLTPFLGN